MRKENIISPIYKSCVREPDLPRRHFCRKITLSMQIAAPQNCELVKPFDVTHRHLMSSFSVYRFEKSEVLYILSVFEKNGVIRRRSTSSWTILKYSVFENVEEIMHFFIDDVISAPTEVKGLTGVTP